MIENRRYVLVSDYTNDSGVGIQAQVWCAQLADLGFAVSVLTARSRKVSDARIRVYELAPRVPYSLRVIIVTLGGVLLNFLGKKFDSFEIFGIKMHTFHLHSDPFESSKIDGLPILKKFFRQNVRALQILSLNRATKNKKIVIFPSKSLANRILGRQCELDNIHILPNALLESDSIMRKHKELKLEKSQKNVRSLSAIKIGFVAQGDLQYKGINLIMENLKQSGLAVNVEVVGSDKVAIQSESDKVKLSFLGHLTREKYAAWLQSINGVIVASKYESFSMCSYESILLGKPVIAKSEIGLQEYYDGPLLLIDFVNITKFLSLAQEFHRPAVLNDALLQSRNLQIRNLVG
jgi:hypothetical protein